VQALQSAAALKVGADHTQYVRDSSWRPLRRGETPPLAEDAPASPVCYVGTPDPAGYVPYWLR